MLLLLPFLGLLTLVPLLTAAADLNNAHHHRSLPPLPSPHSPSPLSARPPPTGDIYLHDASGVVYDNSSRLYYLFASGLARGELIAVRQSTDGYHWTAAPPSYFWTTMPDWVRLKVPNTEPGWWAPDIAYLNGYYHLYYAISSGGSQHSCIGLAVNARLDPADPLYRWQDAGPVTCSTDALPYNCIDPHVFVDGNDGSVWMNWGSAFREPHSPLLSSAFLHSQPLSAPLRAFPSPLSPLSPRELLERAVRAAAAGLPHRVDPRGRSRQHRAARRGHPSHRSVLGAALAFHNQQGTDGLLVLRSHSRSDERDLRR